jgi:hypothetical protein
MEMFLPSVGKFLLRRVKTTDAKSRQDPVETAVKGLMEKS